MDEVSESGFSIPKLTKHKITVKISELTHRKSSNAGEIKGVFHLNSLGQLEQFAIDKSQTS